MSRDSAIHSVAPNAEGAFPARARERAAVPASILAALILALALSSCQGGAPLRREVALEWYELGNSWFDKSDWKKAGSAYSRAIALDPSLSAASYNHARALSEAGDYPAAIAILEKLDERDPGNVRVLAALAYALYRSGDPEAALAAYERVLSLDPYAADAIYNAALLRAEAGDKQAAVEALAPLVASKPEDTAAMLLLGRLQAELGLREDAIATLEKARELGKADTAALERLGLLYEQARRFSEAMDTLDAATKSDAKLAKAWFSLARIRLSVAEDGSKGIEALKKALDAGFSDREAAAALIAEPVLAEREAAAKLLADKGLLGGEAEGAAAGPEGEGGAEEPPSPTESAAE